VVDFEFFEELNANEQDFPKWDNRIPSAPIFANPMLAIRASLESKAILIM